MPHLRGELVPGPVHLMQHQKEVPRSVEMVIQRPVCIALLSPINSSEDKRREREREIETGLLLPLVVLVFGPSIPTDSESQLNFRLPFFLPLD